MTNLTGGLDPKSEYVLTENQMTPNMQEGINWWLWDDEGRFGFPRFAVERFAPDWNKPHLQMNFYSQDGLVMRNWQIANAHKEIGPDGNASHFGGGGLWFDCIEPFERYRAGFSGAMQAANFEDMLVPEFSTEKLAPMRFDIEARPVVPPWIQGTMSLDAKERMSGSGEEARFMGGDRLEQLCRVEGTINYDGKDREFKGGALRIRRAGIRDVSGFRGHCWQSAVFPSGKAFGYIAYPPGPDGERTYSEGFIFLGQGDLIPAKPVECPWLKRYRFSGDDIGLVMETADGTRHNIEGRTSGASPFVNVGGIDHKVDYLPSIGHYSWGGEAAYGMCERITLREDMAEVP